MPQFILPLGTPEAANEFAALDAFTRGYIEAMFFTDASDPDDGDLQHATFADLAPESLAAIIADCTAFKAKAAPVLEQAYRLHPEGYNEEQAGRDYWFTRNGHGTGFWDRKELETGGFGDLLSDIARYSTVYLYRGDDGQVWCT